MALYIEIDRNNGKPPRSRRWWGLPFEARYGGSSSTVTKKNGDTVVESSEYGKPHTYRGEDINSQDFSNTYGGWRTDFVTKRLVWRPYISKRRAKNYLKATKR